MITYYNYILTNFCESVFLPPLYSPYFSKNSLVDVGLMPNYLNIYLPLCDSLFYYSILFYIYMKRQITIKTSGILTINHQLKRTHSPLDSYWRFKSFMAIIIPCHVIMIIKNTKHLILCPKIYTYRYIWYSEKKKKIVTKKLFIFHFKNKHCNSKTIQY